MKCLALMSGGLDSYLAIKVIQEQGIDVLALNFQTPFCSSAGRGASCGDAVALAGSQQIDLRVQFLGAEFLDLVAHPPHGWGRNMNPCIDCRILMLRRAKALLEPSGASFVITGEVVGQRPMSQHLAAMRTVETEGGLEGLLLRPLSAKLLPPTIPETKGWVDRERLLDLRGRSRKVQLAMAKALGLESPPTPAGGCLLTDPGYATRLRDVLGHAGGLTAHLAQAVRFGRYVRLSPASFLMVGRNERDNAALEGLQEADEWILRPVNCVGPVILGVGPLDDDGRARAAGLMARYADAPPDGRVEIEARLGAAGEAVRLEGRRP
jgi:tRNA U34 2-thiouridine synthase MnmA/TrmU